jgi:hypothetical protein
MREIIVMATKQLILSLPFMQMISQVIAKLEPQKVLILEGH